MDFDGIFLKKELCSRSPKSPQNHRVVFFFRVFFVSLVSQQFLKLKLEQVERVVCWRAGLRMVFDVCGGMGCRFFLLKGVRLKNT